MRALVGAAVVSRCSRSSGRARADLLVPMVRDAIRGVDVAARVIDVSLAFLGEQGG